MSENSGARDGSGRISTGDVSGTMVVGDHNTVSHLRITAEAGAAVTVHGGPLPAPVKRASIAQLPRPAAEPLVGRERDARDLQQAIEARQLVQIWGDPGVGKSALLRHLACTVAHGPDGAAYVEAGGRTADDIAQAIFDISFDAPNYKPSWEVMKEHLKTLRLRVYLDDVCLDDTELRRLVDTAARSTFVFTARQRSAAEGVHAVQLKGLASPAAAQLVAALLARELRVDEVPVVGALCDAVEGNPLRLRRIALSAAMPGKGLPGIADLPELLPALLNKVEPEERDLLYLLGSLSGAELAPRHLDELLGRTDTEALADGLVRHGLLLASETGYSCPPDVAECALTLRGTEFPADRLCRTLTSWVEARDTTPDDVAAHFQALDVAVLRAERNGHAALGVALARAASPKLALSRQFDAWGSLLGVGWAAARSAGDEEGEEFFLRQARTRRKVITRAAQTTALALEAGVLWHELTALSAQSAPQAASGVLSSASAQGAAHGAAHGAGHTAALGHSAATTSTTASTSTSAAAAPGHAATTAAAPGHTAATTASGHAATGHTAAAAHAPRPVIDLSGASAQPHAAVHSAAAPSTTPTPPRIDLSSAHSSAAHSAPAASTGHSAAVAGAAGAKGGASALAVACAIGFAAVVGVGAVVYANEDRPEPSPVAASSYAVTPTPDDGGVSTDDDTVPAYDDPPAEPSPSVDPVCETVISELSSELQRYSTDSSVAADSVDSYNSAMNAYNSGASSVVPDDSTLRSQVGTVISDLQAVESTLQEAIGEAEDTSVAADLQDMLTATQQLEGMYRSYQNNPQNSQVDPSGQAAAMNAAADSLESDCGA
ncbi:hypothetical protein ABZY90_00060 [Streptomyces sp. NPDC006422]|uniref:hypothetical protein n=1 Tax=unclassified Streptomyces TaxID=2593676 RepID=UPI0033A77BE5